MFHLFTNFKSKILLDRLLVEPNIYHHLVDFTWRVSDCEGLVGFTKLNHDLNDTVSVFDLKQLPRDSQL